MLMLTVLHKGNRTVNLTKNDVINHQQIHTANKLAQNNLPELLR